MSLNFRPRFGVEIEFSGVGFDPTRFVELMNKAGLTTVQEEYNHSIRTHYKLTTDSSAGWELVTPPLRWEDRHALRETMRLLVRCDAQVTNSCGLHIHHEWPWRSEVSDSRARGRKLQRVIDLYEQTEPLLHVLMPDRRFYSYNDPDTHNNTWAAEYCSWNEGQVDWDNRYKAVNVSVLERQETIEFRQYQGTLDPTETIAWLELTRQIVHAASVEEHQRKGREPLDLVFETISKPSLTYIEGQAELDGTTLAQLITIMKENN